MPGEFMRIEMLPAQHGDCLLVEYGDSTRTRRLLIDGGTIACYPGLQARIDALPAGDRRFELIVLSHVDADHVEGLVRLFAEAPPWHFAVDDVWFNGWRHMESAHGLLGARQGEFFSALLARRLPEKAWNGAFAGQAVVVPKAGALPQCKLAGGMTLTLLSPTVDKLAKMRDAWRKDLAGAIAPGDLDAAWKLLAAQKKYVPGKGLLGSSPQLDALLAKQFQPDDAAANGSSIAFLAEFAGKRVKRSALFLADAHPDAVCDSLRRLLAARQLDRLKVDAVKIAHHGSKANTSDELMALLDCPRYLFSTNGAQFQHPDEEAVARVVGRSFAKRPTLVFNYLTEFNGMWQDAARQKAMKYKAVFNPDPTKPMLLKL